MAQHLVKSSTSGKTLFTPELIRQQLGLILRSEVMRSSGVLFRFLEFVVEETLEAREFEIKEYTIGINVFKRPDTFKPQSDAIVRINAGRLRRLLNRYYEGPGQHDPLRIDIPK